MMKTQKTMINKEQASVNRIKDLYEQTIRTGLHDTDYRAKLMHELLMLQKEDGSFSVIDNYRVDMDIRIFYVYEPTYYATAAMMYIQTRDNSRMSDREKAALLKGLSFVEGRHLSGHGYDATRQQLQALQIYKNAGLYDWLLQFGDTASAFISMINGIIERYREAVKTGRTISDWNVDFRQDFEKEVTDYEEAMVPEVWYACYGSNMSSARFMRYISNCSDTTSPSESRPFTLPFDLYFAGESQTWGQGYGVTFVDDAKAGTCPGRIYRIRRSQFSQVQQQEGSKYTKRLSLGTVDGIPVYTFTSPERRTDEKAPSTNYIQTIMTGLQETYPDMNAVTALSYLIRHGALGEVDRKVLLCIRNSEHAVTLQAVSDESSLAITRTRASVKKLAGLGLIKQDGRSVRAGHRTDSREALFYTCPETRDLIGLIKYGVI